MRRSWRTAFLFAIAAPIGRGVAVAQSEPPQTVSLRIDNDAFDFWMAPWNRPDEEYTSGVHLAYDGGSAPWWSRAFLGRGAACAARVQECRTARTELGQDIYTPAASVNKPEAGAGARPNAGWLYLSETARALGERRSDELTITLGVTGPPSLARYTQRLAHDVAPAFNRPTDWASQIGFEPGAIVRYEQRRRALAFDGSVIGFDVIPAAAISVGNVTTAAELGFQSRIGWNLGHPWLVESGRTEVSLFGGLTGRAIARDLFLDGNTFRPGPHVGHEPLVGSGELGTEIRYRAISLTYRAVNSTRAYAGGPKWHPWASMVGGVTFSR